MNKDKLHGEVLAVGPGSRNMTGVGLSMDIEVGDTIIYTKFSARSSTQR